MQSRLKNSGARLQKHQTPDTKIPSRQDISTPSPHSGRNPQQPPRQLKIDVALLQSTGNMLASRHLG